MRKKYGIILRLLCHTVLPLLLGWGIYQYAGRRILVTFEHLPVYLPKALSYQIPDGLWMYAFTSFLYLWHGNHPKERFFWLAIALALGVGYELSQYMNWINGTADLLDTIAYTIGWALAISINSFTTKKK